MVIIASFISLSINLRLIPDKYLRKVQVSPEIQSVFRDLGEKECADRLDQLVLYTERAHVDGRLPANSATKVVAIGRV